MEREDVGGLRERRCCLLKRVRTEDVGCMGERLRDPSPDLSLGLMADAGSPRGRVSGVDFSVGV
jgi:hypothetical protein